MANRKGGKSTELKLHRQKESEKKRERKLWKRRINSASQQHTKLEQGL